MQQKYKTLLFIFVIALIAILVAIFILKFLLQEDLFKEDIYKRAPQDSAGEQQEVVLPISMQNVPKSGFANQPIKFDWNVDNSVGAVATHSAIHWGTISNTRQFDKSVGPSNAKYREVSGQFLAGQFNLPRDFSTTINFPSPGTYHFRYHVVIGGLNYWSDEHSIEIK